MFELRLALRLLRKQPVVTLTTLLALTVGIGMATAGFTLVDAVLFSKLPFPNGDRFVLVDVLDEPQARRTGLDPSRWQRFREHAATFAHLGAFRGVDVNLRLPSGEVVPVAGAAITPASIAVFPYRPVLGRMLEADDSQRGAAPVALVRESLWRRHFSARPDVVGAMVTMSGVRRTIVGVMPDAFEFPSAREIWLPLVEDDGAFASARIFGVLAAGVEPPAAAAQLATLSQQHESADPAAPRLRLIVYRFTEAASRGVGVLAAVVIACLVLVLVVIAANIANLVLARTVSRSRELAVRTALGATRRRLVGEVLLEVLIVCAAAAAIGLAASQAALVWIRGTLTDMPFWIDFTASARTMLFTVVAALVTACVGGLVPALRATRRDTADVLSATPRASAGFGLAGGVMVAAQVALSIALLNGALLMARGVAGYMRPAIHAPAQEVLTARIVSDRLPPAAIVEAAAALPGVAAAGASTSLPGLSPEAQMTTTDAVDAAGPAARPAPVVAVTRGFFETFGARAEPGRLFGAADYASHAPPVAIVNQPFVTKFFGGTNPIGRRLRVIAADAGTPVTEPWREIVGVVPDLGLSAGDAAMAAGFYVPLTSGDVFHLAIRAPGDASRLGPALRRALNDLDAGIQVRTITPLQDVGREDRLVFAGIGAALGTLGGMAMVLSVIGTYAVLSLAVTRRTREIGIRTALGATHLQVLRAIMGRTVLPPAGGALAGMVLGQGLVAARGIFAFRLPEGSGAWGLAALGAVMCAAALLSAWVPARRALAVAPADALRAE